MTSDERARRAEQGRRIKMARSSLQGRTRAIMSRDEFAEQISAYTGEPISRTILEGIEKGERDAEVGIVKAIAKITGLSEGWLYGDRAIPGYFNPWDTPAITQLELALTA